MKICFLSSCGRGFTPDLARLHQYLCSHDKKLETQVFIRNELSKAERYRKAVEIEKRKAYKHMENVISADMSLHEDGTYLAGIRKRILTGVLYDYVFKEKMRLLHGAGEKSRLNYCSYSDILVTSPLMKELISQDGVLSGETVSKEISSPFGADLCREESVQKVIHMMRRQYSFIGEKKMIAILLNGKGNPDSHNIRHVLDHFGGSWSYAVNHKELLDSVTDDHGSTNHVLLLRGDWFPVVKILYVADVLVTNVGFYAAAFSAARKPVYALAYSNNWFEKYIASQFPTLFLRNLDELNDRESQFSRTKVYQKLWDTLSYPGNTDPEKYVWELLTDYDKDGEKQR